MLEERDAKAPQQGEFWVVRDHLPMATAGTFYRKLDETLRAIGFAEAVREVCRPAYRRFDKKREGRRTSNEDWVNPHDPEAKVGRIKDGACDMVYKPEHLTDLETEAIIRAEVRAGDAGDSEGLCDRVLEACKTLSRVCEDPKQEKVGESLTIDEGYFSLEEVCAPPTRTSPISTPCPSTVTAALSLSPVSPLGAPLNTATILWGG